MSVQLHDIKKVIVINHRDCGAAKIAYGAEKIANKEIETETHRSALIQFKNQLKVKQPKLVAELYLMDLDGSVISFN
jgi:carbonic anhydrase